MDKLKEMGIGERVVVIAAIVLLIDSFLPWYRYSIKIGDLGMGVSYNGWGYPSGFMSMLAILLGIAMGVQIVLNRLGVVEFPEKLGSMTWGRAHTIAGVIAFLLVLIKLISNTDFTAFGIYIGLLSTAALGIGGFLMTRDETAGDTP